MSIAGGALLRKVNISFFYRQFHGFSLQKISRDFICWQFLDAAFLQSDFSSSKGCPHIKVGKIYSKILTNSNLKRSFYVHLFCLVAPNMSITCGAC